MAIERRYPTIEDVLQYEEYLLDAVEKRIDAEVNPRAGIILRNLLSQKKFSLSSFQKIQEIDDALDELRVMSLNLPYPEEQFAIDRGKTEHNKRNIMTVLLFGLFGFELVK